MWKKEENPAKEPQPKAKGPPKAPAAAQGAASRERAAIGPSISIRGDVTGDEDLLIQGRVDGSVKLEEHTVTVGPEGDVKASIVARVVTVEGKVEGDLTAEEQVALRATARVRGDISAPSVVLEDGARFLGGVDMGDLGEGDRKAGGSPRRVAEEKARAPSGSEPKPGEGSGTKGQGAPQDSPSRAGP